MWMSIRMRKAFSVALVQHSDQKDRGGVPIHDHCVRVAFTLYELMGSNEDAFCAGMLHDAIEDTEYTRERCHGDFGGRVADVVAICTHDLRMSYEEYINSIADSGNLMAITLKIVDLLHNTDPTRAATDAQIDLRAKTTPRYLWALGRLTVARARLQVSLPVEV